MAKKVRQKRIHPDVRAVIAALARLGHGPAAIERKIKDDPTLMRKGIPHIKTIQGIARENPPPPDPSGPWQLDEHVEPEDAALVLPVVAAVALPGKWLTRAEGSTVARLRRSAPGLPPYTAYVLARSYMAALAKDEPTQALDAFLAYAPWSSSANRKMYEAAVDEGFVPGAPALLYMSRRETELSNKPSRKPRRKGAK